MSVLWLLPRLDTAHKPGDFWDVGENIVVLKQMQRQCAHKHQQVTAEANLIRDLW
jgi:hypothetical protein